MKKTTLKDVFSQLKGNDLDCSYKVTNNGLKFPKTTSGRAKLIYHNRNILIRWDNETKLEIELEEIPPSSFADSQSVNYDGDSISIETSEWDIYFNR